MKLDPNLAIAKNNLAYLMADEGKNLDRALDLAQEAKSQLPENGNVADTLGYVLLEEGDPRSGDRLPAGGREPASIPASPDLGVVRMHLATAYEANKRARARRARSSCAHSRRSKSSSKAARERGVVNPVDPPWAGEARTMLARLPAAAAVPAPASEAPAPAPAPASAPAPEG